MSANILKSIRVKKSWRWGLGMWVCFFVRLFVELELGCQGTSAPISDELNAQGFMDAFIEKVEGVRSATRDAPYPDFNGAGCLSSFDNFRTISVTEAKQLVTGASNKQCSLDPVPTWLVKRFVDDLSPFIAHLINATFLNGYFPASQKCAILTPLLKKASLDPYDLNNYRPVSNLSFISKIIERAAYQQIYGYLQENRLLPEKQSAYRRYHSTETAVLDVLSDAFMAADAGQVTLLGLLDQSSAFDMVDHKILLQRLEVSYGICGLPLQWITSYLSGRTQYVQFNGKTSQVTLITCGVPQGSVLGPLLFIVYTAEVIDVVDRFGYAVHVYADDLQLHTHVNPPDSSGIVQTLSDCVEAVKDWMSSNRLKLNPSKTEIIWLGSSRRLSHCPTGPLPIAGAWITPSKHVRDLGVIIDSDLSMSTHVRTTIRNCYFHLRQLRLVRHSLTKESAHALVRAMIHCRLDYCNSVLSNQPMYVYNNLQSVLRTAARLVLKLPGYASVTEIMRKELHWLGFPQRISYKLCTLTYKCLHGMAPDYLTRRFTLVSSVDGRSHLRSAAAGHLVVPITRTKTIGTKSFHYSAPKVWNSLPLQLRDCSLTYENFKRQLKTCLF